MPIEPSGSFPLHTLSKEKAMNMLDELEWDGQGLIEEENTEDDLLPSQKAEYPNMFQEEDD